MGCNQSKSNDIKQDNDRNRNQSSNQNQSNNIVQSPSKQIGGGQKDDDGQPQEVSYSQLREMDNDFFKDIIDRTAQKFIDVSAVGSDAKDFMADKDYSSQIKEANFAKTSILYSLPHLSQACQHSNLHNLLSQPVPFDEDLMNKCSSSIVTALNNINVKDCGELVVFFGNSLKN